VNIVTETIKKNIHERGTSFVFPSQTAAGLWAIRTCTLGLVRSVQADRFLAWDRFKEKATEEKQRTPVTAVMRKLFARSLIQKKLLKSVIPQEYAENGGVFSSYIAGILPSLGAWEKLAVKTIPVNKMDCEDLDFILIKNKYSQFLNRYDLYEPSWEEINIEKGSQKYIIFFPELIEDFFEYENLLKPPEFTVIRAKDVRHDEQNLFLYQSVRTEIRSAVLEIQRLHTEEKIPYEEIAVSVPGLEEMEAGLLKEFYLRGIPAVKRAGSPLGQTGAGRLFNLINQCTACRFSFESLKALILNEHIPWKEAEKNKDLIRFGIEYNCVASYLQDGKEEDIWEEAFRETHNKQNRILGNYYRDLKKNIQSLSNSKNFTEARKNYFIFKNIFLDMEKITPQDNNIVSRCIEELSALIELEQKFNDPDLVPSSPLGFYITQLDEKEYVRAGQNPGVNIFKWRVAAASPYSCHFILNASQTAATVLYQPMKFLRQDKRKAIGLADRDATADFFNLYSTGAGKGLPDITRISASSQTFSGWAIPHILFAAGKTIPAPACPRDPYEAERNFWKQLDINNGAAANNGAGETGAANETSTIHGTSTVHGTSTIHGTSTAKLDLIYPLQYSAFTNWKENLNNKKSNFTFFSAITNDSRVQKILKDAIPGGNNSITVTPTLDLNDFYQCPILWMYRRLFSAKEYSLEAALLDDTALGLLYHRILEALFTKIKSETGVFNSELLQTYKQWTREITREEILKEHTFNGPLAVPLVTPQAAGISKKLNTLLDEEKKYHSNYRIAELEFKVSMQTGNITIKGVIDRVSISPQGSIVIVDYKTGEPPVQIKLDKINKEPLSEFQMPLYIMLYEEVLNKNLTGNKIKADGAMFYSINRGKAQAVVGKNARANSRTLDRNNYEQILEAAQKQINEFGQKVNVLDFTPRKIKIRDCMECVYKTACRTAYFLNKN